MRCCRYLLTAVTRRYLPPAASFSLRPPCREKCVCVCLCQPASRVSHPGYRDYPCILHTAEPRTVQQTHAPPTASPPVLERWGWAQRKAVSLCSLSHTASNNNVRIQRCRPLCARVPGAGVCIPLLSYARSQTYPICEMSFRWHEHTRAGKRFPATRFRCKAAHKNMV